VSKVSHAGADRPHHLLTVVPSAAVLIRVAGEIDITSAPALRRHLQVQEVRS
jgi:hypothetical protein